MYLTLKNSGLYIYTLSIFKIFKTVLQILFNWKMYSIYSAPFITFECFTWIRFYKWNTGFKGIFLEKSTVIII